MLVQTFLTEPAVEGLALDVVRWFAWSRDVEDDTIGVDPEAQDLGNEHVALIDPYAILLLGMA